MNENDSRVSSESAAKEEGAGDRFKADEEWEQRRLCRDESCIGVIGPDGRCKECGKPFEEARDAESEPADKTVAEPPPMPADADATETASDSDEPGESSEADIDWEKRILCSDESCIGVIGPDGRCKECGKPLRSDG